ncbi:PAS domain S-box/diguanylate cyclase (GGDEF) domain-containing protein [Galdieria sulphuraria]|uniref:PAS domain S-box/diguanylate cyclase (GGDEF) domain-containing protein n=1 Tax=Galdieria sulphuraria TaxID=130081 RepID=M2YAH8_GALSU|nr:PAS domain S-box/diguanylate cyclase (GGDEF) domain-containing protein [Galdieria sulphuraria]EME32884.1 PAS domain S-box/diguanylate cyclase (GGDEF) domain-containing protein [Galdieria sulphuraria]|eukprot:XP_005709404.1 PAS domain S-box/diguanylate cyclase (GGDEF) domain-containing protein [Galdieria sulphuraria]
MQVDHSELNDSTDSVKSVSTSPKHNNLKGHNNQFSYKVSTRETSSNHQHKAEVGTLVATTEDSKNSHREVERKRRMTISSKIEQLRGLLPSLHQTRKVDVVSTLSATVDYVQSTLSENEKLKAEVAKLREEMKQLQEQLKESRSLKVERTLETAIAEKDSDSCIALEQQKLRSSCPYRGPLKIDYSFPWTRYIPPTACDLRLASPEDLQRSCQILQLLSTVKNCYSFICDIQGHLVWLSDSVKDVLGYKPEELLGSDVWSLLHPEDLDAVYPIVQTWHEIGFTSSVHLRRRREDGSFVELKSCFTNLLSSSGEVEGCVCIETMLEGSSDRWLEAVYRMDLDGRFIYASPSVELMTGYRVEEMIGSPYTFNVHFDEQDLIRNNLQRIISSFDRQDLESQVENKAEEESVASRLKNKTSQTILTWFRRIAKSGDDIWLVSLTVAAVDKQTGQPNGFLSIEHDITMHVQRWASVLHEMADNHNRI